MKSESGTIEIYGLKIVCKVCDMDRILKDYMIMEKLCIKQLEIKSDVPKIKHLN